MLKVCRNHPYLYRSLLSLSLNRSAERDRDLYSEMGNEFSSWTLTISQKSTLPQLVWCDSSNDGWKVFPFTHWSYCEAHTRIASKTQKKLLSLHNSKRWQTIPKVVLQVKKLFTFCGFDCHDPGVTSQSLSPYPYLSPSPFHHGNPALDPSHVPEQTPVQLLFLSHALQVPAHDPLSPSLGLYWHLDPYLSPVPVVWTTRPSISVPPITSSQKTLHLWITMNHK